MDARRVLHLTRALVVAFAIFGTLACGESAGDAQNAADTLSRRQRDRIISELPVPGASGVGRALDATDLARERAERLDSIR